MFTKEECVNFIKDYFSCNLLRIRSNEMRPWYFKSFLLFLLWIGVRSDIFFIVQENKNCQKIFKIEVTMVQPMTCHISSSFLWFMDISSRPCTLYTSSDFIIFSISSRLKSRECIMIALGKVDFWKNTIIFQRSSLFGK